MTPTATRTSIPKAVWNRLLGHSKKPTTIPKDSLREALETVVFVVVLVFLLKQFVVEAFVIPTGSMAETLYGTQKIVTCVECGYNFPLNSSREDATEGRTPQPLLGYCCPNCRSRHVFSAKEPAPGNTSGDRVLVLKPIYHREKAQPGDVIVFKFPEGPQKQFSAINYIKRLWGVGGQTIAIHRGDLYVCESLEYPVAENARPENANDLWRSEYSYHNNAKAMAVFEESRLAGFPAEGAGFKLIRKSPTLINAMQRIVYDNEYQANRLKARSIPPRWKTASGWSRDGDGKVFQHSGPSRDDLTYQNPLGNVWDYKETDDSRPPAPPSVNGEASPALTDNFQGYNGESVFQNDGVPAFVLDEMLRDANHQPSREFNWKYWVADLIVECEVKVANPADLFVLDLGKGRNRNQAIFQDGRVKLVRTGPGGQEMATGSTPITSAGTFDVKFANVDCRLTVWVNGKALILDGPVDYSPLPIRDDAEYADGDKVRKEGWNRENDSLSPVKIGATGEVAVSKLKVWRDTYYTRKGHPYISAQHVATQADTYYVQPGHYLALGDNSAYSSDSRYWGTVPERLLLGKAVFIFFPLNRIGLIK